MKVETYEIEEINASEASTMAADAEAIELAQQLGLEGQQSLYSPDTATRFPYPRMSAAQVVVFGALFPDKASVKNYRQGIIPLRVLQVIAYCKNLPQTGHMEIWHAHAVKEDPILVGRPAEYSGENYLLARWGDSLPSFEELSAKAIPLITSTLTSEINSSKSKLTGYLNDIENIVRIYVLTGNKPSWGVYD